MNRQTTLVRKEDTAPAWHVVDASDQVLGRLATRIATVLMGKHKPSYTPHVDTGDFVVVVNAQQIQLTGRKLDQKYMSRYSGHPGGQKLESYRSVMQRKPELIIENAVRRMLPKNKLGRTMLSKLKVYAGPDHPHQAQQPTKLSLNAA